MKKLITFFMSIAVGFTAFSYTPAPFNNHDYTVVHERATLPSKYDSRDLGLILPARNQGLSGCCWAFSATDVAQALFYKNGYETGYLAPQIYPNCAIGYTNLSMQTGGNEYIAISTNVLLKAPVYASKVGDFSIKDTDCPEYSKEDIAGYILSTSDLPTNDRTAIKEAIMKYGSVMSSIYINENDYYDGKTVYCYSPNNQEPLSTNHSVNIIGWDDSKGSWIVKNSWGENWGLNGTFLVSYNDYYISKSCVSFNSFVATDEISNVYTYNTAGLTGGHMGITGGENDPHSILVAHDIPKGESVEYIATYIQNPNTKVQIVVQYEGDNIVYVGEEETIKYPGVHLHKLTKPVVSNGNTLLFEVTYTSDMEYPVATEVEREGYNTIELSENQWFYLNRKWKPATELGYNFILYVYTKEQDNTDIEENESINLNTIVSGEINPEIWNNAVQATVFDLSGRNCYTIKAGGTIPPLNKGYYILVIDMKDGSFITEKFNVF